MEKELTTGQAAELLNVSRQTIWNMILRGSMRAFKIDPFRAKSAYIIPQSEVDRILKARKASLYRKPESQAD